MTSLEAIEEVLLGSDCTLERICAELAKLFGVRSTEVGNASLGKGTAKICLPR